MGEVYLASAGDDIKLWDCNGYSLVRQFNPHTHNVSSICWSHDNTSLASASSCGDKVVLTCTSGASAAVSYDFAAGENRQVIAFNSMSRYIMGGGPDGVIHVWDLKTRKFKKSYKDHKGAITSIQFNWNDTVIASGSESGEIILYNVVNGLASSPMVTAKLQAVREVRYSHFRKSLLAACTDSGVVGLWDTARRSALHTFRDSHTAPATSLAFSPLNEMLLMSVGLDRRIVCYDVHNKQPVKTMTADSPLTSIDLLHDGATLAAGSTRGKIYIYDLRHGAQPISTISAAHKASVQSLKFQCSTERSSKVGGSAKKSASATSINNNVLKSHSTNGVGGVGEIITEKGLKVIEGLSSEKTSPHKGSSSNLVQSPNLGSTRDLQSKPPANNSYDADVFSPVRDRALEKFNHTNRNESISLLRRAISPNPELDKSIHITERRQAACPSPDLDKSNNITERKKAVTPAPVKSSGGLSAEARLDGTGKSSHSSDNNGGDAVFSPLLEGPGARGNTIGGDTIPSFAGSRPINSPLRNDQHPARSNIYSTRNTSRERDLDGLAANFDNLHSSQESLDSSAGSMAHKQPSLSPPRQQQNGNSSKPPAIVVDSSQQSRLSTGTTTAQQASASQPSSATSSSSYPTATVPLGIAASAGAGAENIPAFQAEFIRNVVEDAMEDVRDQLRQDVLNLHMDMNKKFLLQREETRALLQHYSVNSELLAEIERLKEENKRLKKTF